MKLWTVTFHRPGTSMAFHALVVADTEDEARTIAREGYDNPGSPWTSTYPYDSVSVRRSSASGPILRWWEEPT